jgi:hypothetical protein
MNKIQAIFISRPIIPLSSDLNDVNVSIHSYRC